MLSTNTVSITGGRLLLIKGADRLTGPVEVVTPYGVLEFLTPVASWPWPEDQDFLEGPIQLYLVCDQNAQNGVQTWFAFRTREERDLALTLTSVPRLGMKTALKILSRTMYEDLMAYVQNGDQEGFKKLPGLGGKTGDQVIPLLFKEPAKTVAVADQDAVAALRALGYKAAVAKQAVLQAMEDSGPGAQTSTLVASGLRLLQK